MMRAVCFEDMDSSATLEGKGKIFICFSLTEVQSFCQECE